MKKITKKEYDKLGGFSWIGDAVSNGEVAVYRNEIIVCCSNCGDYFYIDTEKLLEFLKN